jgi:hypothetical protein
VAHNIRGKLVGIAKERVVLIQKVGLSAESANSLQTSQVLQFPLCLCAIQFG